MRKSFLIKLDGDCKLAIFSDVHIGAKAHARKFWKRSIKYCLDHKIKVLLNGDILENAIVNGKNPGLKLLEQEQFPADQFSTALADLKPLVEAFLIVAVVGGNHEERSTRDALLDLAQVFAEALGVPYLDVGGYVRVHAKKQRYTGAIQHGSRHGSNTWTEIDKLLKIYGDAEFVAIGHNHDLNHRRTIDIVLNKDGEEVKRIRHSIRTGTYLDYALYARKGAYQPTFVGSPIITFGSDNHDIKVDIETLSYV